VARHNMTSGRCCAVQGLPAELGLLQNLTVLSADTNSISRVRHPVYPRWANVCSRVATVVGAAVGTALEAFQLLDLQVPSALLRGCTQLCTLTLHQNPITFAVRHAATVAGLPHACLINGSMPSWCQTEGKVQRCESLVRRNLREQTGTRSLRSAAWQSLTRR
jgi:hypothetical protein